MKIKLLDGKFAVCRLNNKSKIPTWINTEKFYSITKTEDELSLVCEVSSIPKEYLDSSILNTNIEDSTEIDAIMIELGWEILKIVGPLDFSLIGILSKISTLLADNGISIFAISTYDTDYILIKEDSIDKACEFLVADGYTLI